MKAVAVRVPYNNVCSQFALGMILNLRFINLLEPELFFF